MSPDKLATTGEAARAVGVSHRSLVRWAQEGTVTPAWRTPGGHLRWDIDQLRRQLSTLEGTALAEQRATT
jgi:excisionase family DNA binding protein